MIGKRILLTGAILFCFAGCVPEEGPETPISEKGMKYDLDEITGPSSNLHSRNVAADFDNLSEDEIAVVTSKALSTGNVDLMPLVETEFKGVDWTKNRTWAEGLELIGLYGTEIEALAKWNSPLQNEFKNYFLHAPDVPYGAIADWNDGFGGRGLQGTLLEALAKHAPESFQEVVGMLDDEELTLSKKRTIAWAMRFDTSGFSENYVLEKKLSPDDALGKDLARSLFQNLMWQKDLNIENYILEKKLSPDDALGKHLIESLLGALEHRKEFPE